MKSFSVLFISWSAILALGCLVEFSLYYLDRLVGKWTKVSRNIRILRNLNLFISWIPSLPFLVLSLVLMLSELSHIRASQPRHGLDLRSTTEDDQESINADIAGDGIRYALLMQAGVLAFAVSSGFFHRNKTGVKELGVFILVFLAYLTCNLWYSYSDLSWIERLVICMQIDALSAALSMTFSDKETLASRWFIRSAVFVQCVAWSAVGYVTSTLPASTGPFAFQVFWGVGFGDRTSVPNAFWLYFSLRILDELHNSWLALSWTGLFNEAEHDRRANIEDELDKANPESGYQVDQNSNISALILHELYISRPATVFTKCIPQIVFSIVPLVAIEILVTQCKNVKGTREWGQRASIIPPALGILHWVYVQGKHIYQTGWNLFKVENLNGTADRLRKVDQFRADPHLKETFDDFLKSFKRTIDDVDMINYPNTSPNMNKIHDLIRKSIRVSDKLLRYSIQTENIYGARAAIHGGAPLHSQHFQPTVPYRTPLFEAVLKESVQITEALLAPRRGDSASDPVYSTPMVLAAKLRLENLSEHPYLAEFEHRFFLRKAIGSRQTCSEPQMKIIMILARHRLPVHVTPLRHALHMGNKAMVLKLIEQGEEVTRTVNYELGGRTVLDNLKSKIFEESGVSWTPNEFAEVEQLLIAHGAKTSREIILEKMGRQADGSSAAGLRRRGANQMQPFDIDEG